MSNREYGTAYHTPVMVDEVLSYLDVAPGKCFVDGTAGGGGHTGAILDATAPDGRVLALDRDPEAVGEVERRFDDAGDRLTVARANYAEVEKVLNRRGWDRVDGWLVDAGLSSHQVDEPERGFSFREEGPLDMRMGPNARTVAEFLDDTSVEQLADVLREFGELSGSRRLAREILEARIAGRIQTTTDLADLVEDVRGGYSRGRSGIHPATLVFQALRIAVNRELDHLERAVASVPDVVAGGGRAVFISFHSLEDRIVKHGFRQLANPCVCPPDLPRCGCGKVARGEVLTKSPVRATDEERQSNPRARSAKLRAFRVFESSEMSDQNRAGP